MASIGFLNVSVPVDDRLVKDPAAAAVPPIAGGLARYVLNPVPLTVELADNVVNAPLEAAVLPIGPGDANLFVNPVPLTVELADNVVNEPAPENPVAVNIPVLGIKLNFVEETLISVFPLVARDIVGYHVPAPEVLSVILTLVALVALVAVETVPLKAVATNVPVDGL